jgi:hypothetical protein
MAGATSRTVTQAVAAVTVAVARVVAAIGAVTGAVARAGRCMAFD